MQRFHAMRVLIVEEEERLASTLSMGLQAEGFVVVHVANGVKGLRQAAENRFDVIVLDIMLPRGGWCSGMPRQSA